MAKRFLSSTKPILMIPACFLGEVYSAFCDLARTVMAPTEQYRHVTAFWCPIVLDYDSQKYERTAE
ncbi:MAG: hypothetical protein ACLRZ6_07635 [Lachnospiraceae bacterium]